MNARPRAAQLRAFTLIELLVVVAIISILAAILIANLATARVKANIARVEGDFAALDTAIEAYRIDHAMYPQDYMSGRGWDPRVLLSVLVSPVAYISSIPWEDPFYSSQRAKLPDDKRPGNRIFYPDIKREPYYIYLNDGDHWAYSPSMPGAPMTNNRRDEWHHFPNWGINPKTGLYEQGRPIRYLWYLTSFGPDQRPTIYACHQIYDPSNGLFSRGDIFRFGPGGGSGRATM